MSKKVVVHLANPEVSQGYLYPCSADVGGAEGPHLSHENRSLTVRSKSKSGKSTQNPKRNAKGRAGKRAARSSSSEDSSCLSDDDHLPRKKKRKKKKKKEKMTPSKRTRKKTTTHSSQSKCDHDDRATVEDESGDEREHFYYVIPPAAGAATEEVKMRHPDACCQCSPMSECIRCPCRRVKKQCSNCPTPFCTNGNPNPPKHYSVDFPESRLFPFSKRMLMTREMVKKKHELEKENKRQSIIKSEMPSKDENMKVTLEESKLMLDNKVLTVHDPTNTNDIHNAQKKLNLDYFSDLQAGSFRISEETGLPMPIDRPNLDLLDKDGLSPVKSTSEFDEAQMVIPGQNVKEVMGNTSEKVTVQRAVVEDRGDVRDVIQNVKSEPLGVNHSEEVFDDMNTVPSTVENSTIKTDVSSVVIAKQTYSSESDCSNSEMGEKTNSPAVRLEASKRPQRMGFFEWMTSKRKRRRKRNLRSGGISIQNTLQKANVKQDTGKGGENKRTSRNLCVFTSYSERCFQRNLSKMVCQRTIITDMSTRDLSVPDTVVLVSHPIWKKQPCDISEQPVHIISRKEEKTFRRSVLKVKSEAPDVTDKVPKNKHIPEVVKRRTRLNQEATARSCVQSIGLVILGGKVKPEHLIPGIYNTSSLKEVLDDHDPTSDEETKKGSGSESDSDSALEL